MVLQDNLGTLYSLPTPLLHKPTRELSKDELSILIKDSVRTRGSVRVDLHGSGKLVLA